MTKYQSLFQTNLLQAKGEARTTKWNFQLGNVGTQIFRVYWRYFSDLQILDIESQKNSPTKNIHPAELKSVNVWNIYHMLSLVFMANVGT